VDEAPPDAPEAVDLESPDPVAEVKAEPEPVPEAESEPEPVVTRNPGPAYVINDPTEEGWIVHFIESEGVQAYIIEEYFKAPKGHILLDTWEDDVRDDKTRDFISGDVLIPLLTPTEDPEITSSGEVEYWIALWCINGGESEEDRYDMIPIEWIYDEQDIDVTTDPADLSEPLTAPPVITITNLGELDLSVDYVIIDDHSGVDPGLVLAGGESADLGVELPADEGIHTVEIWSNDPDENMVLVTYEIEIPVPTLTVVAADFAAGIGSELFGVTVACDPAGKEVSVNVVLEAMSDGDDISPVEVVPVTAPVSDLSIIVKTLFDDESGDEAEPGVLYQYRVWMTVDGVDQEATLITNVGLWHWSTFTRLRSVSGAWEAKVAWDAIQVPSTAGFSVYVALRKWDGETLWDVTDSEGEQVVVSQEVEGIAAGEATLLLDKPDQKVLGDEVEGGETWMAGMRSGYYFFTYMAENDAGDPWAERIGCPPEAL
jgi:hypothetical protein